MKIITSKKEKEMKHVIITSPPAPDHRAKTGLGPAGQKAVALWVQSELDRLDKERSALLQRYCYVEPGKPMMRNT